MGGKGVEGHRVRSDGQEVMMWEVIMQEVMGPEVIEWEGMRQEVIGQEGDGAGDDRAGGDGMGGARSGHMGGTTVLEPLLFRSFHNLKPISRWNLPR